MLPTCASWVVVMVDFLSAENDVGGMLGRLMFGDAVAERRQVDPGEHRFALPEHDRCAPATSPDQVRGPASVRP